jgi:hypothetical protein
MGPTHPKWIPIHIFHLQSLILFALHRAVFSSFLAAVQDIWLAVPALLLADFGMALFMTSA